MTADVDTTLRNGPQRHFWAPGEQVLWRYRGNGTDEVHICRPVTVVRDDPELLAVWMAPGTLAAGVRQAGRRAVGVIRAWGPPFRDRWEDWRPDPDWPVPALPADWDRPAV